jgi:hypothetical protein
MNTEELKKNCEEQLKDIVTEIRELEQTMNVKKEQYFRLQGAIEALTATSEGTEVAETTEPGPEV